MKVARIEANGIASEFEQVRAQVAAWPPEERRMLLQALFAEVIKDAAEHDPRKHPQPYRSRRQMPDPTKPADAEENKREKQTTLRIDPDTLEKLNRAAKEAGISRSHLIKATVLAALDHHF